VFDGREGIVEVMQKCLPFLILRGAAEADGVVFQRLPLDKKGVAVLVLD
jgi:hypothetical protein